MRLGTKFALLIVGTVAVPFLAMSLVAIITFVGLPNRMGTAESIRTMMALNYVRHRTIEPSRVAAMFGAMAPDNDLVVLDENRRVVYSTLHSDSLLGLLMSGNERASSFSTVTLTAPDGAPFSILVGFHTGSGIRPGAGGGVIFTIVIGSLVAFMTAMSIFIIRSINVSIGRLEEGTRRISVGDLDFVLTTRGNDRIASLTRSFEVMRQQVRQDAEARSRFIMSVSHDLKTPLSSITGYLDAIDDGMAAEPATMRKYLAIIRDKTGLLESRISQLIDYVKLETDEWKRSRETVQLAPFLQEAMTVFRTEAGARGRIFDFSIEISRRAAVSMDPDLVSRALENLVQNAFLYAEPGTALRFVAADEGGSIVLRIVNRGSIAEADLPFIFEPFYRGTRARREGGFGLGLSVVKWVASSHGWALTAHSSGGETAFTITIPSGAVTDWESGYNKPLD